MEKLVLLLYLTPWLMAVSCMEMINDTEEMGNSSDPNKDMYVIHAMVYQVGIVTNKTGNDTENEHDAGNQEALTFYHNNGSQVDLSQIPAPLLTNVKAQSLVGVAPVSAPQDVHSELPWSMLNNLTSVHTSSNVGQGTDEAISFKSTRDVDPNILYRTERSFDNLYQRLFKRDTPNGGTPVAISNGNAVIPQTAGVQSLAIPPLLMLNNNLSDIPVPIPNTSIVRYAKINTLVTQPEV